MCLSTAYRLVPEGEDEKICEYISDIKVDGDRIVMTAVLGKETEVQGIIKSMDFVGSKVYIGD